MDGVSAHGVRVIQTIPAASSGTGNEIVLTDEYWYADDLHMNVVVKHNDPRTGSVTMTLTQVTRGSGPRSLSDSGGLSTGWCRKWERKLATRHQRNGRGSCGIVTAHVPNRRACLRPQTHRRS